MSSAGGAFGWRDDQQAVGPPWHMVFLSWFVIFHLRLIKICSLAKRVQQCRQWQHKGVSQKCSSTCQIFHLFKSKQSNSINIPVQATIRVSFVCKPHRGSSKCINLTAPLVMLMIILPQDILLQSLNSPQYYRQTAPLPPSVTFLHFSGQIFNKEYLPATVMIHREQQAEPPFLSSPPSPPLSKSYQAVISKSGVIWALPRGGAQLKLRLAQIRDTQNLLAPP